ncbi:mandelate racemase/muconate lactonizing enzyme family protein [Verticiella sediminum]|uniref:Mandelate racemase/muconate lactonizing enzyme family protein n=1 Tax=Verticiella sediminum TaxID=1247510 RepID=A0A556AIX5_9BURK|nr:mandelate racemase/muconate lactonizing enzyme family protein [Verticiella sediminum]TSH92837.1 mandelate racemase/muconate lactonizing enzyme family protein [Verticiella sediminum]
MKIAKIEAIPLAAPFTFRAKGHAWRGRDYGALELLLVRVETEDGLVGWGESFAYNCQAAVRTALQEMIAPIAIGRDARDIAGLLYEIQRVMHLYGRSGVVNYALSGLDIALWDIAARRAGVPLCELFGAASVDSLPAYASLFRYDDPDSAAAAAQAAVAEGYGAVKVHTRGVADVVAVRQALDAAVPVMMDTNCAWLPGEAAEYLRQLQGYDIRWVEEPLYPPEDFETLAELQRRTGQALAIGENACTAYDFQKILRAQAARFVQPSVIKVGGISEFRKVATLAEVYGATLAPHSPYYGPGLLATLHLMAAYPARWGCIEFFMAGVEAFPYGDALVPVNGAFALPRSPGLGLEPSAAFLRDYRVEPATA